MNDKEEIIVGDSTGIGCMIAVAVLAITFVVLATLAALALVDCR